MQLPIELVAAELLRTLPTAIVNLRYPLERGQPWYLDVVLGETRAEVEWSPVRGFGVAVDEAVFGTMTPETFVSTQAVISRVLEAINARSADAAR